MNALLSLPMRLATNISLAGVDRRTDLSEFGYATMSDRDLLLMIDDLSPLEACSQMIGSPLFAQINNHLAVE